jgi:hypothetical protein
VGLWTREEDHRPDCPGPEGVREDNRPRRESLAMSAVQRYCNPPPTAVRVISGNYVALLRNLLRDELWPLVVRFRRSNLYPRAV